LNKKQPQPRLSTERFSLHHQWLSPCMCRFAWNHLPIHSFSRQRKNMCVLCVCVCVRARVYTPRFWDSFSKKIRYQPKWTNFGKFRSNFGLNSVKFRDLKHRIRFGPNRDGRISPKFGLSRSNPRSLLMTASGVKVPHYCFLLPRPALQFSF